VISLIERPVYSHQEDIMRTSLKSCFLRFTLSLVGICVSSAFAAVAGHPHYVVTNDDVPPRNPTSVTFYTVDADGLLTLKKKVLTGGIGIAGGYFAANRVNVLDDESAECVYASEADSGYITGVVISTLKVGGRTRGSTHDGGTTNGIGLAMNSQYLYASFTDSNTIGTFVVKPGCKLRFVGDTDVKGLQGGTIDGMALLGNMLVVTYGDGSIESFDISAGTPVSNGDEQNSTGSHGGNSYPNGVEITQDGHFAIFGDTATSTIVEVSDISSGKLTPTVVYHLGDGINSSNILLSPDETLLYISNNQGDTITAAFFDSTTGTLSKGCRSGGLKGYVKDWTYLAALALENTSGTGGVVYVAEYGAPSSIGVVNVTSTGGQCTLKESPKSPVSDPNSPGLLSIASFPPPPL
jgi:6-phosphogluconolactonase (cycloisomerase 2 family)